MTSPKDQPAGALLPCPFCGNERIDCFKVDEWLGRTRHNYWVVSCGRSSEEPGCGASILFSDEAGARRAWNRRVIAALEASMRVREPFSPAPAAQQDELDARRYRWLRKECNNMPPWAESDPVWDTPESLDAAIDAALAAAKTRV